MTTNEMVARMRQEMQSADEMVSQMRDELFDDEIHAQFETENEMELESLMELDDDEMEMWAMECQHVAEKHGFC